MTFYIGGPWHGRAVLAGQFVEERAVLLSTFDTALTYELGTDLAAWPVFGGYERRWLPLAGGGRIAYMLWASPDRPTWVNVSEQSDLERHFGERAHTPFPYAGPDPSHVWVAPRNVARSATVVNGLPVVRADLPEVGGVLRGMRPHPFWLPSVDRLRTYGVRA